MAQDYLLAHLKKTGLLDLLAIKGGTAIRKLYAGNEGRFSLDLDFSTANIEQDHADVELAFLDTVDGLSLSPFSYRVSERRGKLMVEIESKFVSQSTLKTKLDFSAAPWLAPVQAAWVPMAIHKQYEFDLPTIGTIRLEENIAEKIARLNRTTAARDMYDLAWMAKQAKIWAALDKDLIRRLAVLKMWVDANGMHASSTTWEPAHEGHAFDPDRWLRRRASSEFDIQDIGALAVPTPKAEELSDTVSHAFSFLRELDDEEKVLAAVNGRDRGTAIRLLESLPGGRLKGVGLY
ncbi:MAG: nucleotidyl transferase AbiEii/AbiGii toxin family protein [Adlercreutzia sp.]|nr:nucleotidyl transferase AbiEii/AbiGii toxin family protein [Adlercreutzia sp.]